MVIHSSILGKFIGVWTSGKQPTIVTYKFMSLDDSPEERAPVQLSSSPSSPKPIECIPIYSVTPDEQQNFQDKLLDIKVNGDTDAILYFDVVNSTQSILEKILEVEELCELDIVVTSKTQAEGRGRRSIRNWTSPPGCAMASFNHRFRLDGIMGKKMGFIQHLVSLSIINSIPEIPDLRIKWPNDIYYKQSKVGGLIVNCSLSADQRFLSVFVGFGVNVDNNEPTDYLNRILKEDYDSKTRLTTGAVISKVINNFKTLADSIKTPDNFKTVQEQYINKWMHTNQEVTVDGQTWTIFGVDDQGFLLVKDKSSGVQTSIGMDFEEFSLPVCVDGVNTQVEQ